MAPEYFTSYENSNLVKIKIIKNILLPAFYFPPISWFSKYLNTEQEIFVEQFENFPKQTFRNRTNIYGANGKLSLIIPIHHSGTRILNEIKMSSAENWKKQHWKSLKSAYQSSPYFEFYEDRLSELYHFEEDLLFKFNLKSIDIILKALKIEKAYSLNNEYNKEPDEEDLRQVFSSKFDTDPPLEHYYQIFAEKSGFLQNLSILDLLCNKGPESLTYLKNNNNI